jgi:general secretion pathway protein M
MSDTGLKSVTARLAGARASWASLPLRERRLVLMAATVVGVALLWTVGIQPAWRTLREAPARIDALDASLRDMQRMAAEAGELRAAPPVGAEQSAAALKAASARLGDKARLVLQGERAVLTLNGVSAEQLRGWMAEARAGARARPVEATLTRGPQGFSGTFVVAVGGAP